MLLKEFLDIYARLFLVGKNGIWIGYKVILFLILLGLAYSIGYIKGKKYEGYRVIRVVDGDTLAIEDLRDKRELKLRIWGINSPEVKECFSSESRETLERILTDKKPRLEKFGYDGYGRLLANVMIDEGDVGQLMIARGAAKVFDGAEIHDELKPSLEYIGKLRKSEDEARAKKIGLWGKCTN